MHIQIGDRAIVMRAPTDLDAVLIETTGSNLIETRHIVAHTKVAGEVAAAILALTEGEDLPAMATLANEIDAFGIRTVADQVIAYLAEVAPAVPQMHASDLGE